MKNLIELQILEREFIRKKNRLGKLTFRVLKLGRWWGNLNKADPNDSGKSKLSLEGSEIDIVAVDTKSKNYILGECKFRNSEMDADDLDRLKKIIGRQKSRVSGERPVFQIVIFKGDGSVGKGR